MAGFQKVIICGHLGKDPEIRSLRSGDRMANISIATSEQWRDKNTGEKKEKTEWHRITVWGNAVNVIETYVRKGDQLLVEGRLETRKWQDNSGQDRFTTEIVVKPFGGSITLIGSRRNGDSAGNGYTGSGRLREREPDGGYGDNAFNFPSSGYNNNDLNDEIPF